MSSRVGDFARTNGEGVNLDQYYLQLDLSAGWHRLLVRVTNGTGPFGHALRFTNTARVSLNLNTSTEAPFGDGIGNPCDVCPTVWDPSQNDADGDGVGDRCDRCGIGGEGAEADSDGDCSTTPLPYLIDPRCGDSCDP